MTFLFSLSQQTGMKRKRPPSTEAGPSTKRSNVHSVSPDLVHEDQVFDNFSDSCMSRVLHPSCRFIVINGIFISSIYWHGAYSHVVFSDNRAPVSPYFRTLSKI